MAHLDFQPQNPPPQALPSCVWNDHILWTNPSTTTSLDLSARPFHEALVSIYQTLTFCELALITEWLEKSQIQVNKELLFAAYQFRYDNKMEKTLLLWTSLPQAFRVWATKHGISQADLYPLCAISDLTPLQPALLKVAGLQLSRSQGAQIVELITECALLKTDASQWIKNSSSSADWMQSLNALRFPQTLGRDSERQNKLLLGWPKTFATRWLRQGDRSGVEVKFFVSSKRELAEKISSLTRVHEGLSDE